LAIVEPDDARIAFATKIVSTGKAWHGKNQIYFSGEQMLTAGKLAFVFPGVDSSFDPQVEDVVAHFGLPRPRHATKLDPSKDLMQIGLGLTEVDLLLFDALTALRIEASAMAGHSIGEWCAMAASGMLSRQFVQDTMAWARHEALPEVDLLFVTAACDETRARHALAGLDQLTLSHDNCPHQVIFCGRKHDIETALTRLHAQHILAQILPFASGFHSPLFAPFITPYRESFQRSDLQEPAVSLWSATTGQRYPVELAAKRELAVEHLLKPVQFRRLVENLYADGYRAFVQVGTGSLVGFIQDTLSGRPHVAISANIAKRSGMQQLTHVCAALWVEGASFDSSLLGLREPTAPAPASKAPGKKVPLQLSLGVPLIKLKMTLPLPLAVVDIGPSRSSDDPLTETFAAVMADIQHAGNDVLNLWRQRQTAPAVSDETPTLPPALAMTASASDDAPAPFDVRITRRLDVNSTIPWVRDHSFIRERAGWPVLADRRPLVPLTMEIELLRAALEAQVPGHVVVAFNNVEAFRWLLVAEPIDVTLRLTLAEYPLVSVEIEGYLRGRAVLAKKFPVAPPRQGQPLQNARACAITAQELYRDNWMFHLDAYRGITSLGPMGDNGIDGVIKVPAGPGALLDNMGQLAGYWVMASQDHAPLAMPIGVQQVRFYGPQPAVGDRFDCETRIRELDEQNCRSDLQLINGDGAVVVEMLSWHTRRYAMTRQFHERMRLIESRTLSETLGRSFMVFEDRYDTALMREYLAVRVLNQPELAEYEALPPRRKRQWLNGRIAAKDAVRTRLWSQYGKRALFPKEVRISTALSGQPLVQPHLTDAFTGKVYVSISHKDRFAVALADDRPVGIDIEIIEQRADSAIALAFTEQELALLPEGDRDEWITRAWAAKEVISKVAGTGMQGKPLQFRLQAVAEHRLCVDDAWVDTLRYQDYVIAWRAAQ
jgi:malonyl CoA-acyl carrier protein transacylase/phosphopantetheinyl transferase